MKKNRVYAGIDLDALRYNMESMHKNIKEGTKIASLHDFSQQKTTFIHINRSNHFRLR